MVSQRLRKVTIKDIAGMCNVSTQTVSRVLNNRADVAQETRMAVEKKIVERGYEPSARARGLGQQAGHTSGVSMRGWG